MTSTDPGSRTFSPATGRVVLPVVGPWRFRLADGKDWAPIEVPGCWEAAGVHKAYPGPVTYQTMVEVPESLAGKRLWLCFAGASYHTRVEVGGRPAGEHTGLWDPFTLEVTELVQPGEPAELTVRLEKPASLSGGPDSPTVPGRFPMRETLVGFLPYVWGHIFGGLWQEVTLEATGSVVLEDVHVKGEADGRVRVTARLSGHGRLRAEVIGPDGLSVADSSADGEGELELDLLVPDPRPWSPREPSLYTLRLVLEANGAVSDTRELRFGLRTVSVSGTDILLGGLPVYPRLALSWGWYPRALHSNPGPAVVREELERLRALGYNGVKLCLWFPPQYYFDLADELGMLLWVELPMWLPRVTDFFLHQTPLEYERLVRLARNHPSVVLYTLGCELNREVGADLLGPLFARVKALVGDALVRDNSGSGEAYGGLLDEFADFYDYHFYSELPYFRPIVDHFSPRWRPVQPWIFGEFCDSDTFRDPRRLEPRPWWASADPDVNPQGARWQFDLPEQEECLRASGFWGRGAELEAVSERQSLLHRKLTLEVVRLSREVSGYVITGEVDTPISTAGMWDDTGRAKFAPDEFRAFNSDLVVLAGWDRRRAWIGGGDRAAPWDHHCYSGGVTVRAHAVVSNYTPEAGPVTVSWSAAFPGEPALASGRLSSREPFEPGQLGEVGIAAFALPEVETPRRLTLRFEALLGSEMAANEWPLWVFPRDPWSAVEGVSLLDPDGRLAGLRGLAAGLHSTLEEARVAVATSWTPELEAFVAAGGQAVLLHGGAGPAGPVPTLEMPYWREAVKVIEAHPAWGDFPHEGWAGLQFYGLSTDRALDTAGLEHVLTPIMRRLDARTMAVHDYAIELEFGLGRLLVSTLAFEGGHGDQPVGIERNVAAAYLLRNFVEHLLKSGAP